MYEVRCIVGDKKLREVLTFLNNNNTLEPPVVLPVASNSHANEPFTKAVPVKGSHPPKPLKKKKKRPIQYGGRHLKGLGSTSVVRAYLAKTGAALVLAREIRQSTMEAGYSPNAYSHAIKVLLHDGTIQKTLIQGEYTVTKPTIKAEVVTDA